MSDEERNDCDQTIALPSGGARPGAAGGVYYTPVMVSLFGETTPTRMVIESDEIVIGRSSKADYSINDEAASRQHAKLVYTNMNKPEQRPLVNLVDLNSRNGVMVNGQRVMEKQLLPDNARIVIGEVQIGYYMLSFPKKSLTSEGGAPAPPHDGEPSGAEGPTKESNLAGGVSRPAFSSSSPAAMPGHGGSAHTAKLCIIDNDFGFASDLRATLEKTGRYSVVVYRNLEGAIRNFDTNVPQLILLDADLAGHETFAMCQKLKGHEKWGNVPIILLFNMMDHDRIRGSLKAGAQSYLVKPIDNISLLTNRVDIHMNINRMISTIKK